MRLSWKLAVGAMIPAIAVLVAGCGGFSGSPSISPASFFLPGLVQAPTGQSPVAPLLTNANSNLKLAESR